MTKVFASPAALAAAVGTHLGTSEWIRVDQSRIDLFAEATGDHQWIHVDAERAASGPFGGTIAHGFLTLSLIPVLVKEVYRTEGVAMAVNYGLNKVRFMSPVRVGSRVRASVDVVAADEVRGGHQVVLKVTVEIEGADKPACVAETVTRLHT
ncbi:MaoC family dehydratase [Streptomyces sp. SID8499]|uniref:MaoC family dehydratase n=1 Tax=Streptomyces sp. SID8499 TaxID=2706106 RepID=UPI0013C785BA|nr:MaoC family dehydratase [Streptomyces sp. SID8499]NED32059.1 MaoC family dehydratase [Streptomyces sp. SID8499]